MTAERLWHYRGRDFHPAAFVIDPRGCGCTDCIVGESTPVDRLDFDDLLAAASRGMAFVDRR